jgi:hypothetical protein
MLRIVAPTIAGLLLTAVFALENAHAQPGSGGSPGGTPGSTPATDGGTIIGTPTTELGKANSWVIRSATQGIAICIYEDPVLFVQCANIRFYARTPSSFVGKTTPVTYKPDGSQTETTVNLETIYVRLESVPDKLGRFAHYSMNYFPEGYEPNGTPKGTKVQIGKIRFNGGANGRISSDVAVRLSTTVRPSTASSTSPCDEPPVDDIGEEEAVVVSATNVPGLAFPLTPVPATNTSE